MRRWGIFFLLLFVAVVCFGRGPNSTDAGVLIWWSIADSIWADDCGDVDSCWHFLDSLEGDTCGIVEVFNVWTEELPTFPDAEGCWVSQIVCGDRIRGDHDHCHRFRFVDTLDIPEFCIVDSATIYFSADDFTEIGVNHNLVQDELGGTNRELHGIDAGGGIPASLYFEGGRNVLEFCAASDPAVGFTNCLNVSYLIYAVEIHARGEGPYVEVDSFWYCDKDTSILNLRFIAHEDTCCGLCGIDTSTIEIVVYSNDDTFFYNIDSSQIAWGDSIVTLVDTLEYGDLTEDMQIVVRLQDSCGIGLQGDTIFYPVSQDCEGPICLPITRSPAPFSGIFVPIHSLWPWPIDYSSVRVEVDIQDINTMAGATPSGIESTSVKIEIPPGTPFWPTQLINIPTPNPWELAHLRKDRLYGWFTDDTPATWTVHAELNDEIKDRYVNYITNTCPWKFACRGIRIPVVAGDPLDTLPEAMMIFYSVVNESSVTIPGEPMTLSYDLGREDIVQSNILSFKGVETFNETDTIKFLTGSSADNYIDNLELYRIATLLGEYGAISDQGNIRTWSSYTTVPADTSVPYFPDDTCCRRVCEGEDSFEVWFDTTGIDTNSELVLRPMSTYYPGSDTLSSPDRNLLVKGYNSSTSTWDTIAVLPPRTMGNIALVEIPAWLTSNVEQAKLRIYWKDYYEIEAMHIDTNSNAFTVDTIDLVEAKINNQTSVTTELGSFDSSFVHIDPSSYLFLSYVTSEPGEDSTVTYAFKTEGFVAYYDDNCGSLEATVNVSTDDITIEELNTATAVSGAFVFIDDGTTQEAGFTDGSGVFNPTADLTYEFDIYAYKQGYRPLKVQHTTTEIYGNEIWYGDIQVLGDVAVESGDTLNILPGTNIYMKPTSAVWNYAYDVNNRTEIMAYGGHVRVLGTEEDPVHFRPGSGGSGLYQWGGLWAKVGVPTNPFLPACISSARQSAVANGWGNWHI